MGKPNVRARTCAALPHLEGTNKKWRNELTQKTLVVHLYTHTHMPITRLTLTFKKKRRPTPTSEAEAVATIRALHVLPVLVRTH